MAVMANALSDLKNGLSIRAAGLVAADTANTGVFVGRGFYLARLTWTACEIATGDESYFVQFQTNTAAATTTWLDGITLAFGNAALMGGAAASAATGELVFGFWNPYDQDVRTKDWVTGTIATGFNYSLEFFPAEVAAF